jgi:hypothetical protein
MRHPWAADIRLHHRLKAGGMMANAGGKFAVRGACAVSRFDKDLVGTSCLTPPTSAQRRRYTRVTPLWCVHCGICARARRHNGVQVPLPSAAAHRVDGYLCRGGVLSCVALNCLRRVDCLWCAVGWTHTHTTVRTKSLFASKAHTRLMSRGQSQRGDSRSRSRQAWSPRSHGDQRTHAYTPSSPSPRSR